jgi:hypothetical protein
MGVAAAFWWSRAVERPHFSKDVKIPRMPAAMAAADEWKAGGHAAGIRLGQHHALLRKPQLDEAEALKRARGIRATLPHLTWPADQEGFDQAFAKGYGDAFVSFARLR